MFKKILLLLLYLLLIDVKGQTAANATEGFYLAPHDLSRESEVFQALPKIQSLLTISDIHYNSSSVYYTMQNISIKCTYLESKQIVDINPYSQVSVSGGIIQFSFVFNFTTNVTRSIQTNGYSYGTIKSTSLNYTKNFIFGSDGFLRWQLKDLEKLTINTSTIKIKNIIPYDKITEQNIQFMIKQNSTDIKPNNMKDQILIIFNKQFNSLLNSSLNHEIVGQKINYSFHNGNKQTNITIIHKLHDFNIDQNDGYKVLFYTQIQNWDTISCSSYVPQQHLSFNNYGGFQVIHMHCLYESVILYLHSKGYFDIILDQKWQVNAFQFYAGDLYGIINNLYRYTNPRTLISGQCTTTSDSIHLKPNRQLSINIYDLQIIFNCSLSGKDKQSISLQIAKWKISLILQIEVNVDKIELQFTINDIDIDEIIYYNVGNFQITNSQLATFKIKEILKQIININVFGTGFPTLRRDLPKAIMMDDYILYFDPSHRSIEIE